MATKKEPEAAAESGYAKDADELKGGKPAGPEHDKSFPWADDADWRGAPVDAPVEDAAQ